MATSYLTVEGIYDNKRMYAVTNWSDEDYTDNWRDETGDNFYTLHAGEVKTYPQYLAFFITKGFVDREMFKAASKEAETLPNGTPNKMRERLEMAVVNKELRKPYEDKTIQEVIAGKESPEVTAMRAQIRRELIIEQGMSSEMNTNADGSQKEEFADLPKKGPGRPRKDATQAAAAV